LDIGSIISENIALKYIMINDKGF